MSKYELREFFTILGCIFAFMAGAAILITGVWVAIDYTQCRGFQQGTGIETKWTWGCYAKVGERWVPAQYVFGDAKELRLK